MEKRKLIIYHVLTDRNIGGAGGIRGGNDVVCSKGCGGCTANENDAESKNISDEMMFHKKSSFCFLQKLLSVARKSPAKYARVFFLQLVLITFLHLDEEK